MANEQDEVQANPEATPLALTSVTQEAISPGDKLQFPSYAAKDLLSIGVCIPCIIRLSGIERHNYSFSLSAPILGSDTEAIEDDNDRNTCCLCLGILQFSYIDDKGDFIKCKGVDDLAVSISEMVKKEGHQIDSFSLEVSVPSIILENEKRVWLYLKRKYGSEQWFQGKPPPICLSAKDALKICITKPLETLLDCKSSSSGLRIRLTYSHPKASNGNGNSIKRNQDGFKMRKIIGSDEPSDISNCNVNSVADDCINPSQEVIFPQETYSRNVSQTRWVIGEERMGEASVEEILGNNILPFCRGDSYKFHAAGREDLDVRMLGSGRPFLVEIQNARLLPSEMIINEIQSKINSPETKLVGVRNLKVVGSEGWALVQEGEAEKQKILQRTPIRVLHRRSPLEREKIIHWMKIEKVAKSSQYYLLHLCTQAGTYIKEFVHGDLGRTHPSIGSILSCRAEILQLDVTDIKMDCHLAE
uniref:tRNA pseudouridine(55) synthase n=1 Tax=Cucumis melo TaxID=3656 RepID=A0A9I9DDZ4_CUCME